MHALHAFSALPQEDSVGTKAAPRLASRRAARLHPRGCAYVQKARPLAVCEPLRRQPGFLRFGVGAHFDKAKAACATGIPLDNDLCRIDMPAAFKVRAQCVVGDGVGQIGNVQIGLHGVLSVTVCMEADL